MTDFRTSRRTVVKAALAAALAPRQLASALTAQDVHIARGPFEPTWESLATSTTPEWFRDAKFGIWNHWSAQCVPEQGDWYARRMYIQGDKQYQHHLETYGHPSKVGWMEMAQSWKAEEPGSRPSRLATYVAAGAKYFAALANHHDNFDAYNSRFHNWNSVKIGPRMDIAASTDVCA